MKHFILTLKLENNGFPPIISKYIINQEEKEFLNLYLEKDFFFQIKNDDYTLNCTNETLTYHFETNQKNVEAFKTLFNNNFFSIDILSVIKQKIDEKDFESPKKNNETIFEMDDEDINYYLTSKKNTPEFRNLDDEKMRNLILETKKTIDLFKPHN